jgi:hypothetical protein
METPFADLLANRPERADGKIESGTMITKDKWAFKEKIKAGRPVIRYYFTDRIGKKGV